MAFEFLSQLDTTSSFLIIIAFILFMLSVKKALGMIKNAIIIAIASALFPIIGSRFLGLPIATDGETIISFITLGLLVYFAYILASAVHRGISFLERGAKKRLPEMGRGKNGERKAKQGGAPAKAAEKPDETTKPFVSGARRKKKSWEKDYLPLAEAGEAAGKEMRKSKKKRRKGAMKKIRVIGGE